MDLTALNVVRMYVRGGNKEGRRGKISGEKVFVAHMRKQRFNVLRTKRGVIMDK